MTASYDIAVVGNGIAGAAAALFLERAGHRVTRLEASPRGACSGAGLLLQPPAIAVLRAAGLDSRIWSLGEEVHHIAAHFVESGRTVHLDYSQPGHAVRACGIRRAVLLETLERASATSGDIRWSTPIDGVDTVRGTLQTHAGETFGPFDLIVGADGVRSTLRSRCPQLVLHDRACPDAAIVCVVDNPRAEFGGGVIQHFRANTHVSSWPVGAARSGGQRALTVALRTDGKALDRLAANPTAWLEAVARIHPPLAGVIRAAPDLPELLPYTYRDVVTRRYYAGRVVLIGDAAHAMSPQLGLGASLALLDAWYLARFLEREGSVAGALVAFDAARRRDIAPLQQWSRWVTPLFQSGHPFASALRKHGAVLFGRSTSVGRRALAALCDVPRELR